MRFLFLLYLQKLRLLLLRRRYRGIMALMLVLYLVYGAYLYEEERSNRKGDLLDSAWNITPIVPTPLCHNKTFLLVLVCSSVHNFKRRQSIRNTWGNTTNFNYPAFVKLHSHLKGQYLDILAERRQLYADYLSGQGDSMTASVRIVFVLGRGKKSFSRENKAVLKEAKEYKDILQYNFLDTYNNLASKTVIALKHFSQGGSNTIAFLFKCDDDTFVNVPNLLHFLLGGTIPVYNDTLEYYDHSSFLTTSQKSRMNATNGVLYGHVFCHVAPHRDPSSKWYVPLHMYPSAEYPKYLSGAGYLLSLDVAQRLYEASLNTTLFPQEDVYITGLCAQRAHVEIQHHPYFNVGPEKKLCAFKGSITQHQMQDDSMAKAWNHVSDYSIKCPAPGLNFRELRLKERMKC